MTIKSGRDDPGASRCRCSPQFIAIDDWPSRGGFLPGRGRDPASTHSIGGMSELAFLRSGTWKVPFFEVTTEMRDPERLGEICPAWRSVFYGMIISVRLCFTE